MFVRALVFLALLGAVASTATADVVYYTETITGVTGNILITGSPNLTITSDSVITMTASADPTTITGPGNPDNRTGVLSVIAPVTITVTNAQGVVIYTGTPLGNGPNPTGDTGVFVAPANLQGLGFPATAGFYDNYNPDGTGNPGGYLLATSSSQFNGYTLNSSIGPVTGTSLYNAGEYFLTSTGKFEIDAPSNGNFVNSTFTANFVPEPSSIAMTAIALLIGGGAQWRRRRSAQVRVASAV